MGGPDDCTPWLGFTLSYPLLASAVVSSSGGSEIRDPARFIPIFGERRGGGAPLVLAKGRDLLALKIREIAENHDLPIIEDKPLARSLYDSVEVDRLIPPQFYKAVAELIFFLHTRKTRKYTGGAKS